MGAKTAGKSLLGYTGALLARPPAYYRKLLKATTLLSIVPTMVIAILIIYGKLSINEGVIGFLAVLVGSIFFAKPYMDDLSTLTEYVENLLLDKDVAMPSLSFLGSVEELSESVQNLHNSWERKQLRLGAALAESSIIFDTIPDILIMLGHDMKIIKANKAANKLFRRQVEGMPISKIIKTPNLTDAITSVMENKRSENIECTVARNNITRDFQVSIEDFPVYTNSGIAAILVLHDITEAKRTRQMIKDFVANASHELRTPLTSISGFIENLREMREDKKTRKQFLDIMYEQSERMGALVNDLLSLSKVEMDEGNAPTDHVKIPALIKATIRRLTHLAEKKNMTISYKSTDKLPEILGDEDGLSQILTNLISNSIKYGYPNTQITVAASALQNRPEPDSLVFGNQKNVIAISVEDKGEGIPDEHLPRITERFYRVNKMRSRNIGGSGLGLAIVTHILNRHHGKLHIESIEGEGSKFTIYLPAA
jgi:two-component system, OmpR family, phosphate regulon sensor histidine kinase PhoR